MAKKYGQTRKDRADESRGMKNYWREERREKAHRGRDDRAFMTGHDPEVGRDSYAGLPDQVYMEMYPKSHMRKGGYLDDSMSEIDAIQTDSERQIERRLSHQK